jgi:hypothetical protein
MDPAAAAAGAVGKSCLYNPDGICVSGGILANGVGGFNQPTMGFYGAGQGGQCTALGLFMSGNVPYTTTGMATSTNPMALLTNRWPNL